MAGADTDSPGSLIPAIGTLMHDGDCFVAGERIVVAVSGGPDSLCLLDCLQALDPQLSLHLHVVHVHHGLRGDAADADAAFVADQATGYNLPFTLVRLDLGLSRSASHGSLQALARAARYKALRDVALSIDATAIATGHTQDDQAETLLLHLLRGSGIDGLAGMRMRRGELVRPLLGQSRQAILAHCAARGLCPRRDASNESRAYRRNAIRLDLMPVLERYNPRIRGALARSASSLALDAAYLQQQASAALDDLLLPAEPGSLALHRGRFASLHAALHPHVLRRALERLYGNLDGFETVHLATIDELASGSIAGRRWQLPRGLRVEASGETLMLSAGALPHVATVEAILAIPGIVAFGGWQLDLAVLTTDDPLAFTRLPQQADALDIYCDLASLALPLRVRGRQPGDRLRPLGLGGWKKVQDLLVDRKVPRASRDSLPLVVDTLGIVWVLGLAQDARTRLLATTRRVLRVRATRLTPSEMTAAAN